MLRLRPVGDSIIEEAERRGKQAGKNAASWVWDFGRMSHRDFEYAKRQFNEDEDSVFENIETPNFLSGENAGESINELLGDLIEEAEENGLDIEEDILNAYEGAAIDEFWTEVHREAALHFRDDGTDDDDELDEED